MLRGVVAAVLVATVGGLAVSAASGRSVRTYSTRLSPPLRTALYDGVFGGPEQATAFAKARAAGATYVRLNVLWRTVAPSSRPAGFVATDPDTPGYSWGSLDAMVQAAEAAGLTPILDVTGTPSWAYAKQPHGVSAGAPKPLALGRFAQALATRYDGSHGVPAVHVFQVWSEPNNSLHLSPVSGVRYRAMVNHFANAVHAVDPANLVDAGGLDPFKNSAARFHSQAPLRFMRAFLCLSNGPHPHATCKTRVHFDAWSHHPYTFDGPFGHAQLPNDVSLGDLPKMRALLRTAVRLHRVVSARPPQFWVTEFAWDTHPPRRHAAPLKLEARWTAEALYQMWRSGVSLATWFLLEDRPSPSPYQSGLYRYADSLANARPKPMRTAFRFPFVAYLGSERVKVWGRDATSTKELVTIERRHGSHGRWATVARIRSNRFGIFRATLRLWATKKDWLRARAPGSGKSLAFSLTRPSPNLRYGPWGN